MATHYQSARVFNVEVEGDHSYIANGFVVHNCDICMSEHGHKYPVMTPFEPGHPNCRCASIPVVPELATDALISAAHAMTAAAMVFQNPPPINLSVNPEINVTLPTQGKRTVKRVEHDADGRVTRVTEETDNGAES